MPGLGRNLDVRDHRWHKSASDVPGYSDFVLRPRPGGGLTWAKTSFQSMHGEIATSWEISKGRIHLDVVIPPNTAADVHVPADGEATIHRLGSGSYSFNAPFTST